MRRRSKPDTLSDSPYMLEALQVAYYHCVLNMPLKNIAELLGKSPATVTRRLDEVRQAGWLRDRPEFTPPPEIWEELKGHMTCTEIEKSLLEHFGQNLLQRVTVLPSPHSTSQPSNPNVSEKVERIGLFAAQRLSNQLSDGKHVVGINWGWSVRHCVENLRPLKSNPDLRFLPLVGSLSLDENDPHYEEAIECSSNRLAQMAATAFGSPRPPRLNTPAYIPRRFHSNSQGLRFVRDFIESDVSYRRIFGGNEEHGEYQHGLIDQVDTLITGLSSLDVQTLPIYRPFLINQEDLPVLQRAGVVGDLALHLLVENETLDTYHSPEYKLVETINAMIVGASPRDFMRVGEKARSGASDGLGVVVLATGAWKASILTTAIKLGAVNELITDQETAIAIAKHVSIAPFS